MTAGRFDCDCDDFLWVTYTKKDLGEPTTDGMDDRLRRSTGARGAMTGARGAMTRSHVLFHHAASKPLGTLSVVGMFAAANHMLGKRLP